MKDKNGGYRVFISSGLVANSGGHAANDAQDEWHEGKFRFVTSDYKFLPEGLDAAKRQLQDSQSWISQRYAKQRLKIMHLLAERYQLT